MGPMLVQNPNDLKEWPVVVCCANVRVVHLEAADSLDKDCFLKCLAQFVKTIGVIRNLKEGRERLSRERTSRNPFFILFYFNLLYNRR